jgi:cytoplasmic iron level regulating protein YaaA (DUF328/UPF0246 family)
MLLIVSPAKALDETKRADIATSESDFLTESNQLISQLKLLSLADVAELMGLSEKLAELNYQRFQSWKLPFDQRAKAAIFLFKGDVYQGIDPNGLSKQQLSYLQNHLRILSGLYGIIRPLDAILPYRLEMGTKLKNPVGKNLYEFWGDKIAQALNQQFEKLGSRVLVNLASNEYFKAVQKKSLDAEIITPIFKDYKNGQYKIISFYAKKARGMMVRYATINQLTTPEGLKNFDYEGYAYCEEESDASNWVFKRKLAVD